VLLRADLCEAVKAVVEMPKHKRQANQLNPLAGVDTNRALARLRLTNAQWRKISNLSSIPKSMDEAREAIETALGMFLQFKAKELLRESAPEIRKELRDIAKDTRNLYRRLSNLLSRRDAYIASSVASQRLTQEAEQDLSHLRDVLLHAPKRLLIAAHWVKDEKRGPKAEYIYRLVGDLDGIREHFTGKKITRSYKDSESREYITYVCKIADPTVGKGTIGNAMRDRITKTGKHRG